MLTDDLLFLGEYLVKNNLFSTFAANSGSAGVLARIGTSEIIVQMNSIEEYLRRQIMILDGAIGTRIQSLGLTAADYHRGRFSQWPVSLVGNNDILCLTAPEVIASIHRHYIEAGADIISTNTFSSNRISQHDYACDGIIADMAREGARIARRVADEALHLPPSTQRKVWVAGSMGPTSKSLTLASDMNNTASRSVTFDEMAAAYGEQAEALIDGGADLLLLETCFDALNAKAALYAIQQLNERRNMEIPVMVSVTVNDRSGRTLTGQTLDAFYTSIAHYPHLLSFGLNCSFGVSDLRAFVEQLADHLPVYISLYPNAGLPNEMGEYDEQPEYTASHLRKMAEAGLLNIAGGCCGTDECHIEAISKALQGIKPRQVPQPDSMMHLSGLEPLVLAGEGEASSSFINIGERTNVAGSRKFARLIAEKKYDEALTVARHQIDGGATIIDINMDDAMLNSREEMQTFCRYISSDPAIARAVLMIDSSDWPTVIAGLKNAQGKCIVNSISLKNGEDDFLHKARELMRLGAAVVVMAFDEEGQATTFERKTAIAQRAYRLLTGIGFPPQDIIFDVNILAVATGIKEHQAYAADFIRAVEWIKQNLPLAKTSGGVSNLSFSFRGNNRVREAMHSVFLYHAIAKGLDMAIVNPAMLQVYDDIDPQLLRAVEDVILNSDDGATERLIALAADPSLLTAQSALPPPSTLHPSPSWRSKSVEERLAYALTKGISENLAEDVTEALEKYGRPIDVIEQPLMQAMKHIGQLFGEGKMFLPQVVKSAQVMKDAVALMQPYIDTEETNSNVNKPCVVLATANGDVHDIGKNIVGIVLACNGFDVIDLGVMVPNETILEATLRHSPVLVGISGLITPSLKEMEKLCELFQREGLHIPILVGGATTSVVHTAVKLAPLYDALVVYGGDASQTSVLAKRLELDTKAVTAEIQQEQELLRTTYEEHHTELIPYEEANRRAPHYEWHPSAPIYPPSTLLPLPSTLDPPPSTLTPLIDWRMFLLFWGFKGETLQQLLVNPEAEKTLREGQQYLQEAISRDIIRVRSLVRFEPATRRGNDIVLQPDGQLLPMLRSQSQAGHFHCLADFFDTERPSSIGLFIVTADATEPTANDTERLMRHALCARLAEAGAEWLQRQCYGDRHALRAAFGYATCPDHSLKRIVFDRLDAEQQLGITLTDRYSIQPSTSVCGLFIAHPDARYFPVGRIDSTQMADYCRRRGITEIYI